MARALIIVDVQPTFCEGGALPVTGGNAIAEAVAAYVDAHRDEYQLIVTTQDWHIDPGAHFSETPDFVDTWPPHGVAGTAEAELHPALAHVNADVTIKKGQYKAAYSGFEGTTEDGTTLEQALRAANIADEIELQLVQGKVCADERDTVADEMEHERVYAQYCDDLSEQILFIAENIHTFIPESTDE